MSSRLVIAALLVVAAGTVSAQEATDPIDLVLEDCSGGGEGPNEWQLLECFVTARQAWDAALAEAYAAVLARLDPESRALLEASQRQWVAFRDAETAFWRGRPAGGDDILVETNLEAAMVDIVKARTIYLRHRRDYFYAD